MKEYLDREISIKEVKVFEYVKKEINFKETKGGGVLLGGKKYSFGLRELLELAQEEKAAEQESQKTLVMPTEQQVQQYTQPQYQQQPPQPQFQQPQPQYQQQPPQYQQQPPQPQYQQQPQYQNGRKVYPHEIMQQQQRYAQQQVPQQHQTYARNTNEAYQVAPQDQGQLVPSPNSSTVTRLGTRTGPTFYAQRSEILDPAPELRRDLAGMKLTLGKKYTILSEHQTNAGAVDGYAVHPGFVYKVLDDTGQEVLVRSHYFRPEQKGLVVTQSYVAQDQTLRDVTTIGNYDAAPQGAKPRLLYQDGPQYSAPAATAGDPRIDNVMQRIDNALSRKYQSGQRSIR